MAVNDKTVIETTDLTNIANAIRNKSGKSENLTLSQFVTEIEEFESVPTGALTLDTSKNNTMVASAGQKYTDSKKFYNSFCKYFSTCTLSVDGFFTTENIHNFITDVENTISGVICTLTLATDIKAVLTDEEKTTLTNKGYSLT